MEKREMGSKKKNYRNMIIGVIALIIVIGGGFAIYNSTHKSSSNDNNTKSISVKTNTAKTGVVKK